MDLLLKILLSPFALLYGAITFIRNYLYDKQWQRSIQFDIPVINIGNLSTGGTGKTPHTDYLIKHFKETYSLGVLSRGYKRKTHGFVEVETNHTALQAGDEPLLLKWKHPDITVAVSEDRVFGIPAMAYGKPENFVVLLDDAFQHRAVKAGLNILLSNYDMLYTDDFILPVGNLREFASGAKRADIIIVTNCPATLSEEEKEKIKLKINPQSYQYLFFSHVSYRTAYQPFTENKSNFDLSKPATIVLLSGIANNTALKKHLENLGHTVYERTFSDHYTYEKQDIESILTTYKNINADRKLLLTTEKDLTRLVPFANNFLQESVNFVCLPIEISFNQGEETLFLRLIKHYIDITLAHYNAEN